MTKSTKIIAGILVVLSVAAFTTARPTFYSTPLRGYTYNVTPNKYFRTVRQGGSSNYYSGSGSSSSGYSSGRSYSSGGSSYGK